MISVQELKLSVRLKNTRALIVINIDKKSYRVVDCSRKSFCKVYFTFCPPTCQMIVAAKDYAFKRRKPKAEVEILG